MGNWQSEAHFVLEARNNETEFMFSEDDIHHS